MSTQGEMILIWYFCARASVELTLFHARFFPSVVNQEKKKLAFHSFHCWFHQHVDRWIGLKQEEVQRMLENVITPDQVRLTYTSKFPFGYTGLKVPYHTFQGEDKVDTALPLPISVGVIDIIFHRVRLSYELYQCYYCTHNNCMCIIRWRDFGRTCAGRTKLSPVSIALHLLKYVCTYHLLFILFSILLVWWIDVVQCGRGLFRKCWQYLWEEISSWLTWKTTFDRAGLHSVITYWNVQQWDANLITLRDEL